MILCISQCGQCHRYLNLLEYQGKEILDKSGVAVQKFVVVDNQAQVSGRVNGFSKS